MARTMEREVNLVVHFLHTLARATLAGWSVLDGFHHAVQRADLVVTIV